MSNIESPISTYQRALRNSIRGDRHKAQALFFEAALERKPGVPDDAPDDDKYVLGRNSLGSEALKSGVYNQGEQSLIDGTHQGLAETGTEVPKEHLLVVF